MRALSRGSCAPSGPSSRADEHTFKFDRVLDPGCSQSDCYDVIGRPLVDGVLDGLNAAVLCYGQTGSGKTYTMEGEGVEGELAGIMPRMLNALFERARSMGGAQPEVVLSYVEIYNERIIDLVTGAMHLPLPDPAPMRSSRSAP